jgi:hypothetical protein
MELSVFVLQNHSPFRVAEIPRFGFVGGNVDNVSGLHVGSFRASRQRSPQAALHRRHSPQ